MDVWLLDFPYLSAEKLFIPDCGSSSLVEQCPFLVAFFQVLVLHVNLIVLMNCVLADKTRNDVLGDDAMLSHYIVHVLS